MRVNEVLARLDDSEIVEIRIDNLCWQGINIQLLHDEMFYNYKWGDMLVTHLGVCDTTLGIGIRIKGEKL